MEKRVFKTYRSLLLSLKRDKVTNPGVVATLLLKVFVVWNDRLPADRAICAGVCAEGQFKLWRDDLVKRGWLSYSYNQEVGKDWTKHSPGEKLVKYINKEKFETNVIATQENVDKVDAKVELLREEMDALVRAMMEKLDPPYTPERAALWIKGDIKTVAELNGEELE